MAWIDVVVVNRDALMKTANFAQCLSEKRPLPDVKLKNQGENENFRRALRDLAFDRLGEVMLDASARSRWQHSEPTARAENSRRRVANAAKLEACSSAFVQQLAVGSISLARMKTGPATPPLIS